MSGELPGSLPIQALLDFYADHARDLPWRRPEAGAWGVLVSEIMLQQTPVVRVLPAYREWMERWPSPADLAGSSPADLLRAWGRLGYPRRALRLQAAAEAIVRDHGGVVPGRVPELLALPGVGDYTARAVAAFAFQARTPVMDTNVRRVFSRAVRGQDSIREPATPRDRAELATLLPADPPTAARFSVAVMELGALVCTAAAPRCPDCPIAETCAWWRAGRPAGSPRRPVQTWQGTDRQIRGRLMARLREARAPLAESDLISAGGVDERERWRRCLQSLRVDGLAAGIDGAWSLPGRP